jgi:hypothetical protein
VNQGIMVITMRKTAYLTNFSLALIAVALLALLSGCKPIPSVVKPGNLFNESLNQQIENLTNITVAPAGFTEFYFNYSVRNDSKYEIARDDVFTLSKGNFTSTEISFLGVKLGDSYDEVIRRLGIPNMEFTPYDNSYKNLDYGKRLGINNTAPALSIHLENDSVTGISVKLPFNKYLHGNTSLGQPKEIIYALLDVPDYQSFVSNYRVFHYPEKGLEIYFPDRTVSIVSFILPEKFKGVKYVTVQEEIAKGVFANVTEPVKIE